MSFAQASPTSAHSLNLVPYKNWYTVWYKSFETYFDAPIWGPSIRKSWSWITRDCALQYLEYNNFIVAKTPFVYIRHTKISEIETTFLTSWNIKLNSIRLNDVINHVLFTIKIPKQRLTFLRKVIKEIEIQTIAGLNF